MDPLGLTLGLVNRGVGTVIALVTIPMANGDIKMNSLYGVRTKRSYAPQENWDRANRYGGRRLTFWSWFVVAAGVVSFFLPIERMVLSYGLVGLLPALSSAVFHSIAAIEILRFDRTLSA